MADQPSRGNDSGGTLALSGPASRPSYRAAAAPSATATGDWNPRSARSPALLPPPATAAGKAAHRHDDGLSHFWLSCLPERTLCGQPRDPVRGARYDGTPRDGDCIVCVDLAAAFVAGTWSAL